MPPEHGYTHLDRVWNIALPLTGVEETSDATATTARTDAPQSGKVTVTYLSK